MAIVVKPNTYVAGQTITAAGQNANEDTLYNLVNGNIDTANISSSAGILTSQIAWTSNFSISAIVTMNSKIFKWAKGADVASAAGTITLGDDGNYFDITGTAAITSITAKAAGTIVVLQFDSTASLVDGSNLKLAGNFTGAAESQIMLISDGTNWFEVSRSPVTITASNALAGSIVQVVNYQTGATASGTTSIPFDDTIPQKTEGDEYMTLAITPTSATNKLRITVVVAGHDDSGQNKVCVALFQDTTADALACSGGYISVTAGSGIPPITFSHYMTSGTTSSTTFKVRAGVVAGTYYFNGNSSGRRYGGALASSITIEEVKV
jgi:hypothetical protein